MGVVLLGLSLGVAAMAKALAIGNGRILRVVPVDGTPAGGRDEDAMDCATARRRLERLLDGELAVASSAAVVGHLQRCRSCRARAETARALRAAIVRACCARLTLTQRRAFLDRARGRGPC